MSEKTCAFVRVCLLDLQLSGIYFLYFKLKMDLSLFIPLHFYKNRKVLHCGQFDFILIEGSVEISCCCSVYQSILMLLIASECALSHTKFFLCPKAFWNWINAVGSATLTLKEPIMTAADDIHKYFSMFFSRGFT